MISKTKDGYVVKSEAGRVLSKPYKTKEQAQQRLREIEYFSNKKGK